MNLTNYKSQIFLDLENFIETFEFNSLEDKQLLLEHMPLLKESDFYLKNLVVKLNFKELLTLDAIEATIVRKFIAMSYVFSYSEKEDFYALELTGIPLTNFWKKYQKDLEDFERQQYKKMSYWDLLQQEPWLKRRQEILKLANYKCSKCDATSKLQVHHVYYTSGNLPWEYPDDALQCLCRKCHEKEHEEKIKNETITKLLKVSSETDSYSFEHKIGLLQKTNQSIANPLIRKCVDLGQVFKIGNKSYKIRVTPVLKDLDIKPKDFSLFIESLQTKKISYHRGYLLLEL